MPCRNGSFRSQIRGNGLENLGQQFPGLLQGFDIGPIGALAVVVILLCLERPTVVAHYHQIADRVERGAVLAPMASAGNQWYWVFLASRASIAKPRCF